MLLQVVLLTPRSVNTAECRLLVSGDVCRPNKGSCCRLPCHNHHHDIIMMIWWHGSTSTGSACAHFMLQVQD
jgi:hypothetical protein